METNNRKGKVMRDRTTASSTLPPLSANPGAKATTTAGMKISISIMNRVRKNTSTEMACAANLMPFSRSPTASFCESIGTKAVVKAPSPKRLRKKLGSLKATKKASETAPAPRMLAKTISLTKPVTRLMSVKPPNAAIDLKSDMFFRRFFSKNCYLLRQFY